MANHEFTPNELKREQWRDAPGYEGLYQVSDLGRVKRVAAAMGTWPGRILSSSPNTNGYLRVGLTDRSGRMRSVQIHRIVAAAFLGPCPPGQEVNHKNGDRGDERLVNLEYVTRSENLFHASRELGVEWGVRGERNANSKLTEPQVRKIRFLWATGSYTQKQIGTMFNVSDVLVSYIVNRKAWKHID